MLVIHSSIHEYINRCGSLTVPPRLHLIPSNTLSWECRTRLLSYYPLLESNLFDGYPSSPSPSLSTSLSRSICWDGMGWQVAFADFAASDCYVRLLADLTARSSPAIQSFLAASEALDNVSPLRCRRSISHVPLSSSGANRMPDGIALHQSCPQIVRVGEAVETCDVSGSLSLFLPTRRCPASPRAHVDQRSVQTHSRAPGARTAVDPRESSHIPTGKSSAGRADPHSDPIRHSVSLDSEATYPPPVPLKHRPQQHRTWDMSFTPAPIMVLVTDFCKLGNLA